MDKTIGRTLCVGDIHGGYRALIQCLERSKFDYNNDKLICLGDVCDGWSETPEVIEELLKIDNLVYVRGNHDVMLHNYFKFGETPSLWLNQGGRITLNTYIKTDVFLLRKHEKFLNSGLVKYIDDKNRIFVHGGFTRGIKINYQSEENIIWDRRLAEIAVNSAKDTLFRIREYKEVYLGHTTVNMFSSKNVPRNLPFNSGNVWLMDTGAGHEGKLTIIDIDTKEYWQSDLAMDLYPDEKGRNN